MEVFAVRHTKVHVEDNICYGQKEIPLAESFNAELELLRRHLPDHFDVVYSSPSMRCMMLAKSLKNGKVVEDSRLLEMNFGLWEGKRWEEIPPNELNDWMNNFTEARPPLGENLLELYQRVKSFLDELRKQSYKKVLIITHAGVIRCLWSAILEIPLKNIFKISVGYGEIFSFTIKSDERMDVIHQKILTL